VTDCKESSRLVVVVVSAYIEGDDSGERERKQQIK
jgi:hypothetical protein